MKKVLSLVLSLVMLLGLVVTNVTGLTDLKHILA